MKRSPPFKKQTTKQQPKPRGTYKAPRTGIDSEKEPALLLWRWQPSHGLGNSGLSAGHMRGQREQEGWKGRLESFTD